jgi:hypothetical protein
MAQGMQQMGTTGSTVNPRTLQMIQQAISSPDPEWEVIMPKVQALLEAQALGNTRTNMFGGGGRGGRGGFGGGNQPDPTANPVAAAYAELQTVLDDPNSSDGLIKEKLTAYRTARDKVKVLVNKAQEEVRLYLTLRQESIMILDLNLLDRVQ